MGAAHIKIVFSQWESGRIFRVSQTGSNGNSEVVAELCPCSSGATGASAASPSQHPGSHLDIETQGQYGCPYTPRTTVPPVQTHTRASLWPIGITYLPGTVLCSAAESMSRSNALGFFCVGRCFRCLPSPSPAHSESLSPGLVSFCQSGASLMQ